ncbi:MAG TPA: hypothetical protein VHM91_04165, partial [Verrucomicrobiales bacterium]|nr:hypothetical protein [Verrucomicrobiales bacterium]
MKTEILPVPSDPHAAATAWALGELTPEECAAFEEQIENDAELAALAEETKEFCEKLTGSLSYPTLELQEAARGRLLFEADRPWREAKVVRGKWLRRLTTMAACLAAGGGGMYWWMNSTIRQESYARGKAAGESNSGAFTVSGQGANYSFPV